MPMKTAINTGTFVVCKVAWGVPKIGNLQLPLQLQYLLETEVCMGKFKVKEEPIK